MPPPKYFTEKHLNEGLPVKKDDILRGFEMKKSGGLICMDQEAIEKQKGVLGNVVR